MMFRWALIAVLAVSSWGLQAAGNDVTGVRFWAAPDHTRVVLDIEQSVDHHIFTLKNPDRLVIDLDQSQLAAQQKQIEPAGLVSAVRTGVRNGNDLRIVLDLQSEVRPKSFLLKPNEQYGHRLVVDLYGEHQQRKAQPVKTVPMAVKKKRDLLIAIDAGHGGEDGGARGKHGTNEKDVVLAIAKKLADLVEKEPGMKPLLIREGDYYMRLGDRRQKARQHRADLFVSIHADAFRDSRVRGSSVYVLSNKGASSEAAKWIADRENRSDLIGGVTLEDKDDLLASVLLDLSRDKTIEYSMTLGDKVLRELKHIGYVHKPRVQQAGFVVLKSLDMPSILVETAFISNPTEEKNLKSRNHQQVLAQGILKGVKAYFADHAPEGTHYASAQHVIERGDTLSEIAKLYDVSLNLLMAENNLSNGNQIRVGQILKIPSPQGS